MPMHDEDFLVRELGRLARRMATALLGRTEAPDPDALAAQAGVGIGAALALSPAGLGALLRTGDGLDAPRALLLGLALLGAARRARDEGDAPRAEAAASRGAWLLDAALGARPELATPELIRLRQSMTSAKAPAGG